MNATTLVWRGLVFHARSHLGALLGSAVGTAVLVGALLVGDSVRESLRNLALGRLGSIHYALASNDRFFRQELASHLTQGAGVKVVAALQLAGTAASADGSARANHVQVLGVTPEFWQLGLGPVQFPLPASADDVILNPALADQLKVKVGDSVLLRVDKPSRLSREAPITPQEGFAVALRLTVRGIAPDTQMGRFGLQSSQTPPLNAFLDLAGLSRQLQLPDRANLLLAQGLPGVTLQGLAAQIREHWQLADAELELRPLPDHQGIELRSSRIFLDEPIVTAATASLTNHSALLTYFVNELRVGERATPYSMVTAAGPPLVPADLKDDEIVISPWLAEDLQAKPGDALRLTYFVIGLSRTLEERTNDFRIRAVAQWPGPTDDRSLMPDFPGLEKAESTRDWDSTLPIKLDRIRPKDEDYWKNHRGTPKAFVRLSAGQQMWANRFGNVTAIRYPSDVTVQAVTEAIRRSLAPESIGLSFLPVREQALAASGQAQDFGQLFLGFSFFLIGAALLLMALLFQFSIERRATEIGTLLALGFTPGRVRRILIGEGIGLAAIGALIGVPGGIAYARAMLYGLSTLWRSAVGTSALGFHATPATLAIGVISGTVIASLTVWLTVRKQARQSARVLLSLGSDPETSHHVRTSRGIWLGWLTSATAMLAIGWAGFRQQTSNPGVFFMAGALLLISGLSFAAAGLAALTSVDSSERPSLTNMGLRNAARRRRRSLATIGLLACGSFLVAAIGVFRLESQDGVRKRASGTGGFALIGESSFPIVHDLNTEEGRQYFGLSESDLAGVRVVPMRVRDGDDASCLNLNRAQTPRLLGVRAERLAERQAFTFAQTVDHAGDANPWLLLDQLEPDGSVPAIGDAASIQWALGKKLGDTLNYKDDRGREFKVRLVGAVANSILQGSLVISEKAFLERFSNESGYRAFLVDVQPYDRAQIDAVAATLSRATQDYGVQFTPTVRRLEAFNAVQNTYLNTFQVLGGLGLLLGSVGLGVVVLRNVLERRGELALLIAVGFRARALRWLVLSEHGALLLLGLLIGTVAALVAVLPTILSPGAELPFRSLSLTLGAVFGSGLIWTWAATQLALRGSLLQALRND